MLTSRGHLHLVQSSQRSTLEQTLAVISVALQSHLYIKYLTIRINIADNSSSNQT
jgi:hypothetical protein